MKEFTYQKDFDEWFDRIVGVDMNNRPRFLDYIYSGLLYSMSFTNHRQKSMFYLYKLIEDIKKERLHLYAPIR